jgi:hypothetical protein
VEEIVCCVTTRRRVGASSEKFHQGTSGGSPHVAAAGFAPPPRAFDALQASHDAAADASRPASDAPPGCTRVPGSSVGSTAGRDTFAHTPCGGNFAIPVADPWRPNAFGRYLAFVPWEVATPWGSSGRMAFILLGHFTLSLSSILR